MQIQRVMPMRKVIGTFFLLIVPLCLAHIGSPDVFFEGDAGPYRLFITVRMPATVPGVAEIEIQSDSADVDEVRIVPMRLTGAGSLMGPTPDRASQSKTDPRSFTAHIWLMEFHALQVRIAAEGGRGKGELTVPVMAEAQRTLTMQKPLGALLAGLILLLGIGCISIVRAAAGEAKLEPGMVLDPGTRYRLRRITLFSSLTVLGTIALGLHWWKTQANTYADLIFKPPHITAALGPGGRLVLHSPEGRWSMYKWSDLANPEELIADHNHLMHLFLVRMPEMDQFWHLHPERDPGAFFSQRLPSLSAGRYQIFADVVTRAGWALTLTGEVQLPDVEGGVLEGDDSGMTEAPPVSAAELVSRLPDDARMIWKRDSPPLKANVATRLRFEVEDRDGNLVHDLEPYMGMAGHVAVIRSDASVFAHLHPLGSPAMPTIELAQATLADKAGHGDNPHAHGSPSKLVGEVSFPYGFPKPGDYRLFVQIKREGQIQTGVFDVRVIE
jgi:hypothetical protein